MIHVLDANRQCFLSSLHLAPMLELILLKFYRDLHVVLAACTWQGLFDIRVSRVCDGETDRLTD